MHTLTFFAPKHLMSSTLNRASRSLWTNVGNLYLIRHGKCQHNEDNRCAGYYDRSELTKEGIAQAYETSKLLPHCDIHSAYVSPLHRARATANILLKNLPDVNVSVRNALAERNFGAFTGESKAKIQAMLTPEAFERYINDKNFVPPDICFGHRYFQSKELYGVSPENHKGESYACVMNRLIPFIKEIKTDLRSGRNTLVVGHSRNLQMLLILLNQTPFEQGIKQYHMEHVALMKVTLKRRFDDELVVIEQENMTELNIPKEQQGPC